MKQIYQNWYVNFYKVQNDKNEKNEFHDSEEEENDMSIADPAEDEMKENCQTYHNQIAREEDRQTKIKTNLEFLLSQNDILPLIRKINKENGKNSSGISLSKFIKKPERVIKYLCYF